MTKTLAFLTVLVLAASPALVWAQAPRTTVEEQNASETRERVRQILDQYPPSVRQVLRLDPSLINRPEYMSSYPTLAAYLTQHPEVAHNPSFFLGGPGGPQYTDSRTQVASAVQDIFIGMEVMLGVMFGIGTLAWLIRSAIDYRRWLRAVKIQTDAHTKIVDRLASNEDLLAYMQSAAGQRFLTASPIGSVPVEQFAATTPVSAPINRIMWSVQVGVVLAVAGAGLWVAKNGVFDEAAQAMQVFAILVMSLGLGFVLSALASYALSRQLGLVGSHADHA
jgi:hypothetical protein